MTVNPLMGTLHLQRNGPLYSNMVIGTLAVDGWAVTFYSEEGTGRGPQPAQSSPRCTKCSGQCTNFIKFDVAL